MKAITATGQRGIVPSQDGPTWDSTLLRMVDEYASGRATRIAEIEQLAYNELAADRQTVAAVQALEAILAHAANGEPDCVARVNCPDGGLVLYRPGSSEAEVLYAPRVMFDQHLP